MRKRNSRHLSILVTVVAVLLGVGIGLVLKAKQKPTISSFEDCVKAGYPIRESFPEVCGTPEGKSFTNPNQSVSPQ